jgi:Putative metallopeptidase
VTETEEELIKASDDTTLFVFYHEMGHALVDVLRLPITGKEEDAVDQLSTLILAESDDQGEGEDAALNGAIWFFLTGSENEITESAFADEHSLGQQRFYNIACWVYGKKSREAFLFS